MASHLVQLVVSTRLNPTEKRPCCQPFSSVYREKPYQPSPSYRVGIRCFRYHHGSPCCRCGRYSRTGSVGRYSYLLSFTFTADRDVGLSLFQLYEPPVFRFLAVFSVFLATDYTECLLRETVSRVEIVQWVLLYMISKISHVVETTHRVIPPAKDHHCGSW